MFGKRSNPGLSVQRARPGRARAGAPAERGHAGAAVAEAGVRWRSTNAAPTAISKPSR